MSQVEGGPEDFGSRKNQREATSESSDEPQKKKVKIEGIDPALNNNAVFVDATNQQVSRAAEVQVAPINKPRTVAPHRDNEINEDLDPVATNEEDEDENANEPLPTDFDDGVAKTIVPEIPKKWGLDSAHCKIGDADDLLQYYGIVPIENTIVPMNPSVVPWQTKDNLIANLVTSISRKFPQFISTMGEERRRLLAEMENEVANVAQQLGDEAVAFLPDFVSAGSWITATQYAQVLTAKSSEQDYTVKMLSPFFEPFFKDLEDKSCSKMPLPPPFEKFNRKPDARAFVSTNLNEFIFFLREDSPVRTGEDKHLHKDLFKLIQLMRCALRLQTLMLAPNYNNSRTLYCFGILCNGPKFQLLQMSVELRSAKDYKSPTFWLYINTEQLNFGSSQQVPEHSSTLFNWLAVIRSYGFYLQQKLLEEWSLNKELLECKTTLKPLANSRSRTTSSKAKAQEDHQSAKNNLEFKKDNEGDDSKGPHGDQHKFAGIQKKLNFGAAEGNNNNNVQTQNQRKDSEVNEAVLAAIVQAVEDKRYSVLHESNSSDKKVVAVCTFVGRVRIFAVKIFGVKSQQKSREVEVMNMIGKHPNINEILATTTLKTGELLVVQPYFPPYTNKSVCYWTFRRIFLDVAKGLEFMHHRGVIHGDLKPSNMIFMDQDRNTRIIDFDYSLRIGIDGWNEFAGTDGFRAPETRDKENAITPKIDIWSLAMAMCSSLELLGEEEKDSLKKRDILLKILSSDAFFAPLRLLLEKMVELDPVNRPTARQAREAIELSIQGKDYTHVLKPPPIPVTSVVENDNKENEVLKTNNTSSNKSPIKHRAMRTSVVAASPLKEVSNLVK